jgi:hypothetical protein
MTYFDAQQQNPMHNAHFNPLQWAQFNPQYAQAYGQQAHGPSWGAPSMQGIGYGLGQAAYGQQYGQYGAQPYGQQHAAQPLINAFGSNGAWGAQPQWGGQQQPQWWGQQQRQLSQQDVSEVVRQLVPALPQILAQAQQPQAALGYAAYGQAPRMLSQQDVNEVVRQILPIVPQIVGMLQGQPQLQHAAFHGGAGLGQFGQANLASGFAAQNPLAAWMQQPASLGQYGSPQFQSAFGVPTASWGQSQRQLTQQDVADVTRQLVGLIPQVIGNLQAINQQRMI